MTIYYYNLTTKEETTNRKEAMGWKKAGAQVMRAKTADKVTWYPMKDL